VWVWVDVFTLPTHTLLKQMSHDEQSKNDFINKSKEYYQFNQTELRKLNDFKENYHSKDEIQ
jgi:hypothetical protein